MFKRTLKMITLVLLALLTLGALVILTTRLLTNLYARSRTYTVGNAPSKSVAIVFGAGLQRDGSPTTVLRDRVATAANLYLDGKVKKLLMSGDNSLTGYNEPGAMREHALNLGVPTEDIVLDYAGHRTYDTCFRARHVFGVRDAILVTQNFHLPRAVYTCNALGVSAVGVPADQRQYRRLPVAFWNLREAAATTVALWEVHVTHPKPVLGSPEPIFPTEAQ